MSRQFCQIPFCANWYCLVDLPKDFRNLSKLVFSRSTSDISDINVLATDIKACSGHSKASQFCSKLLVMETVWVEHEIFHRWDSYKWPHISSNALVLCKSWTSWFWLLAGLHLAPTALSWCKLYLTRQEHIYWECLLSLAHYWYLPKIFHSWSVYLETGRLFSCFRDLPSSIISSHLLPILLNHKFLITQFQGDRILPCVSSKPC